MRARARPRGVATLIGLVTFWPRDATLFDPGAGTSFGDAVNLEVVAEQVVAMMVGSIGLIAAVPSTTSLAAPSPSRSRCTRWARRARARSLTRRTS